MPNPEKTNADQHGLPASASAPGQYVDTKAQSPIQKRALGGFTWSGAASKRPTNPGNTVLQDQARPTADYSASALPPWPSEQPNDDATAPETPDQYRSIIKSWAQANPTDPVDDRIDDLLKDVNRYPGPIDPIAPYTYPPDYNGPYPNTPDYNGPNSQYREYDLRHVEEFVEQNIQLLYDSFASQFSSLNDRFTTKLQHLRDDLTAIVNAINNQSNVLQNRTGLLNNADYANGTYYVGGTNRTLLLKNNGRTASSSDLGGSGSNGVVKCATSTAQAAVLPLLCVILLLNLVLGLGWYFLVHRKKKKNTTGGRNITLGGLGPRGAG